MEESVGKAWHRFVRNQAVQTYPAAKVHLEDLKPALGIWLRALGQRADLQIEPAIGFAHGGWRSRWQKISGTGEQITPAYRHGLTVYLPQELAVFPHQTLNRRLYYWLTALSSQGQVEEYCWIHRNLELTQQVTRRFPGTNGLYLSLLQAYLPLRTEAGQLPDGQQQAELAIRRCLWQPQAYPTLFPGRHRCNETPRSHQVEPVALWLHWGSRAENTLPIAETDQRRLSTTARKTASKKRKRANAVEEPDGKSGLLAFRLESLLSWAEYIPVDRTTDEAKAQEAEKASADLDQLALARSQQTLASPLQIDLQANDRDDDQPAKHPGTAALPEWDYRKHRLIEDHCQIFVQTKPAGDGAKLPSTIQQQAKKLRRQIEQLLPQRVWLNAQPEGSELDLQAWLTMTADLARGHTVRDGNLYRSLYAKQRNLSCLLLADVSLSTDAWINNQIRVIDVIRDSLLLFSEALTVTGDRFAIQGFSSRRRHHVDIEWLKHFHEAVSPAVHQRIMRIEPGYYTRMGAAIRYATDRLSEQDTEQHLLLLLTDGKPNDVDLYEGRYGIEDTRHAIYAARRAGITTYCITIDQTAEDYLPYLFGKRGYSVIHDISQLPSRLPQLYARLSS